MILEYEALSSSERDPRIFLYLLRNSFLSDMVPVSQICGNETGGAADDQILQDGIDDVSEFLEESFHDFILASKEKIFLTKILTDRVDTSAIVLMIKAELLVHPVVHDDPVAFFEIGIQIGRFRILLLQLFADLIDPVGILAVGDRHDRRAIGIGMLCRIGEGLFHALFIAQLAALSAFRFILEVCQVFHICDIVIAVFDETDRVIVEILQVLFQGIKSSLVFLVRVDIGVGEEDGDLKILRKVFQRVDRADTAADVDQQVRSSFQRCDLFEMFLIVIHYPRTWNRRMRRSGIFPVRLLHRHARSFLWNTGRRSS